ncbi:hypothetical protein T484DRAFT_2673972 [Baffinella frigidus]|nr:hypothetical protein T484DRAFT_2673972 [Cryptophyta sp. CCMP2293]
MEAIPQVVLESIFRYSTMRVQWRNSRLLLLLESLANLHWAPERDARAALEPEIKALMKMRTSLLPDLMDSPAWLGAHTNLSADDSHDAREWHLYYYGPWATLAEGGDVRGKGDGDVLKRQSSGDRDVATAESRDRSRSRPASEERGQEGARQSGGGGDGEEAGGAPGSRASTAGGGSAGGGSAGSREGPQRGGTSAGREGDGSAMGRQPGPGSAQGQGGVSFFSPPHAKSGALFG